MDETENAIKKKGMWLLHEGECEMNPHSYPSICHKCDFEFICSSCNQPCCGFIMNSVNDEDLCPECLEEAEILKYSEEKRKRGEDK